MILLQRRSLRSQINLRISIAYLGLVCSLNCRTTFSESIRGQRRPWSDCAKAQSDLAISLTARYWVVSLRKISVTCLINSGLTRKHKDPSDRKRTFWHVSSAKTQISLRIRTVWPVVVVRTKKFCMLGSPNSHSEGSDRRWAHMSEGLLLGFAAYNRTKKSNTFSLP